MTYSHHPAKRAAKDRSDRERMLERLRKRLDKPYQLKAAVKRGCNQFLQMELDADGWKLDEAKIEEAARYDGYYAVITNNLNLSTEEVSKIYGGPARVSQTYLDLASILKLPQLKTNMTLTKFRSCTKLNLTVNLKK